MKKAPTSPKSQGHPADLRNEDLAEIIELGRRVRQALHRGDQVQVFKTKRGTVRVVPVRIEDNVP